MDIKTEILAQYDAVREKIGLIDRSDVGKLAITGPDRFTWLQGMVSNDVRLLEQGVPRLQACILDATGHLLSDLTLINVRQDTPDPFASVPQVGNKDFVLLDLPRENTAKIAMLLDRFLIMEDVEILDVSDWLGCWSLQGPEYAGDLQSDIHDQWYSDLIYAVQADYTGSGGIDLYFAAENGAAKDLESFPGAQTRVGAEAQEILRIEAGFPKYGADMDESVIALEANLGPTHISFTKGCYVGQEIIARIESRGHTNRALTGLVGAEGETLTPGTKLFSLPTEGESSRETGRITSSVPFSPAMNGRPIALGYVRHEHRAPGSRLRVGEEGAQTVEVVELPFYRPPSATTL